MLANRARCTDIVEESMHLGCRDHQYENIIEMHYIYEKCDNSCSYFPSATTNSSRGEV